MKLLTKKFITGCALFTSAAIFTSQAWATTLSFAPSSSSIMVGDTIDIDVVISDLNLQYVGAFDFDVTFDEAVLSFDTYALTDNLGSIGGGDAMDLSTGDNGAGTISLSELSFLWDLSFQTDSFTLATLSFSGMSQGSSELSFGYSKISDDWGYEISTKNGKGLVEVTAPVPEPATMFLFGTGLVGLVGSRLRRKKKA